MQVCEDLYAATEGDSSWENIDGWDEGDPDLNEWWGLTKSTSVHEEFPNMPKVQANNYRQVGD